MTVHKMKYRATVCWLTHRQSPMEHVTLCPRCPKINCRQRTEERCPIYCMVGGSLLQALGFSEQKSTCFWFLAPVVLSNLLLTFTPLLQIFTTFSGCSEIEISDTVVQWSRYQNMRNVRRNE